MTYNFLTTGLQNVLLLLAVVEELSSPTFICCSLRSVLRTARCVVPNFVNLCITLLTFSSLSHKDIKIRLLSTQ